MYYVPADGAVWPTSIDRGPHFTVSNIRCEEIQKDAPKGFKQSMFRIVREFERAVDLEWV
jgi:hypothetical protein